MDADQSNLLPQAPIVAPVRRYLSTSDLPRSLAFYRDVLGFTVKGEDAVECGPARIEFSEPEGGPQIVFFQARDAAALREEVLARGGKPSELEKVNWIKMEMFEIRDPDGHTLWFGQSYHQPDVEKASAMMLEALPEMPLDDVTAGVAYYRDVLGFKINHQQEDLGVMYRDKVTLVLIPKTEGRKGIGSCYVYVADADGLYAELRSRGANVQGEPVSHPWGLRDFAVLDAEGNRIRFGQPFE